MEIEKYLHVCRNYQTQWNQLCTDSIVSKVNTNKHDKLMCSLMQNILTDCNHFRNRKLERFSNVKCYFEDTAIPTSNE